MESTEGFVLKLTNHAKKQIEAKGLDADRVYLAFSQPDKLYPNKKYAGQFRVVGAGLCLVGKPQDSDFVVFTIYEDGIMTAPRPDQLNTPEGKAYAELYRKAMENNNVRRANEYYPRAKKRAGCEVGHMSVR